MKISSVVLGIGLLLWIVLGMSILYIYNTTGDKTIVYVWANTVSIFVIFYLGFVLKGFEEVGK